MEKKRVITEVAYQDVVSERNYFLEACRLLQMSEEEVVLAEKLMKGPVSIEAVTETGMKNLSLAFGHTKQEVYLYPVVAAYMSGELPDTENGTLPAGMELVFPSFKKIFGGSELVDEIINVFSGNEESGEESEICYVLVENGRKGAGFFAEQAACRLGMPLLLWNGEQPEWQEMLLTAVLYDAMICVDARGWSGDFNILVKHMEQLSYRVSRFFILLENRNGVEALSGKIKCLFRTVPATDRADREACIKDYMENSGIVIPEKIQKKLADGTYAMPSVKHMLCEFKTQIQSVDKGVLTESAAERIMEYYDEKETGLFGIRQLSTDRCLDDLCLPVEHHRRLSNVCAMLGKREKVMKEWGFADKYNYGNGISLLFYGAPGTGKTMAAQAVAGELGMPLYRVDLSQLISKYIGETQKNIGKVFEQAKQLNGILLFDEADALFAKRNEVNDAQDKYANAETAYLLQRIEECDGICILATNLLQNFDEAFRRRITYMLNFPMPDESVREQLWQKVFPAQAELSVDINATILAENFELSGATIKNAAFQAAFQAAVEDSDIGMKHILSGIANEYKKLNKSMKPEQRALMEKYDADFS